MSLYKQFKTDQTAETEGTVLQYLDGVEITVARAGGANKRFQRAMDEYQRKFGRQIKAGILPEEVGQHELAKIYASHVILGWENVTDENGFEMSFTHANVVKLLMDLPDLFTDIIRATSDFQTFKEEDHAAEAGN